MEQQIQKEKRMEQNKRKKCRLDKPARIARNADHDPLAETPSTGSRFTGTLITHHMERNPWHVPDALDVGRNSKNYWT